MRRSYDLLGGAERRADLHRRSQGAEVSSDLLQALRRRSQEPHGDDRPSGDERISEGGGHGTNARGTRERGSTGDRRFGSDGISSSRRRRRGANRREFLRLDAGAAVRTEGGP